MKKKNSWIEINYYISIIIVFAMENCNEIVNYLYIGNKHALENFYDYELIVNCTPNIPFPSSHNKHIRIPIMDASSEESNLFNIIQSNNILEEINEYVSGGQNVLVNCNQGKQRSCAVVACYLIKYHNYSPTKAIRIIQYKRPQAFVGSINFINTIKMMYSEIHKSKPK